MIQTDASKITQKELDHIHRMTKIARIGRINAQVRTKKSCEHVRILREALLEIASVTTAEGTEAEDMAAQIQGIVRRALEATKGEG